MHFCSAAQQLGFRHGFRPSVGFPCGHSGRNEIIKEVSKETCAIMASPIWGEDKLCFGARDGGEAWEKA